jgi:hypothetical protein
VKLVLVDDVSKYDRSSKHAMVDIVTLDIEDDAIARIRDRGVGCPSRWCATADGVGSYWFSGRGCKATDHLAVCSIVSASCNIQKLYTVSYYGRWKRNLIFRSGRTRRTWEYAHGHRSQSARIVEYAFPKTWSTGVYL